MLFSEIAKHLNKSLHGNDGRVTGLSTPERASFEEIIIVADQRTVKKLNATRAGYWLLSSNLVNEAIVELAKSRASGYILSDAVYEDWIQLIDLLHPPASLKPSVHPTAVIHPSCRLGEAVTIQPYACIGEDCDIEPGVVIGSHVSIGRQVRIGRNSRLYPHVTVYDHCQIGAHVIIHAGAVIGSDGFGYYKKNERYLKIPHIGKAIIEDDVEIGANSCIDRATLGETRIKKGTKLDNLVQVAHNVLIGENTVVAAQAGIAGSTIIGDSVTIAGQAGIVGHVCIGHRVIIGAQAGVIGCIEEGKTVSGYPAREHRQALQREAYINKIPKIWKILQEILHRERP